MAVTNNSERKYKYFQSESVRIFYLEISVLYTFQLILLYTMGYACVAYFTE